MRSFCEYLRYSNNEVRYPRTLLYIKRIMRLMHIVCDVDVYFILSMDSFENNALDARTA